MKRRFSKKTFALALLIHFLGTWWLFTASFVALAEWKRTGAADPVWLTIWAWVLQPVSMFALHFLRLGFGPSGYFYFFMPQSNAEFARDGHGGFVASAS